MIILLDTMEGKRKGRIKELKGKEKKVALRRRAKVPAKAKEKEKVRKAEKEKEKGEGGEGFIMTMPEFLTTTFCKGGI